jgi:hypothetical protein
VLASLIAIFIIIIITSHCSSGMCRRYESNVMGFIPPCEFPSSSRGMEGRLLVRKDGAHQ